MLMYLPSPMPPVPVPSPCYSPPAIVPVCLSHLVKAFLNLTGLGSPSTDLPAHSWGPRIQESGLVATAPSPVRAGPRRRCPTAIPPLPFLGQEREEVTNNGPACGTVLLADVARVSVRGGGKQMGGNPMQRGWGDLRRLLENFLLPCPVPAAALLTSPKPILSWGSWGAPVSWGPGSAKGVL